MALVEDLENDRFVMHWLNRMARASDESLALLPRGPIEGLLESPNPTYRTLAKRLLARFPQPSENPFEVVE